VAESDIGAGGETKAIPRRRRTWLPVSLFFLTLLLALILHRCQEEPSPPGSILPPHPSGLGTPKPPDTVVAPETTAAPLPKPVPPKTVPKPGTVTLHCREGCVLLYSLQDSIQFKSYEDTLVFKRNTTLWISGIDSLNRQAEPVRVDYVIERNPGACKGNSMPISNGGAGGGSRGTNGASGTGKGAVCMDLYEWPDSDNAVARAFVSQKDAADSCRSVGKRLCSAVEWKDACQGPDREAYPYGSKYNENHCPSKEPAASRSGRFPVCRSYYGVYDMTGNLWEWTSTPAPDTDFFMVAGGNWTAGNEATCGYAKFSFYPTVRYPFVGFRCCQDAPSGH
jgi:hypothetical protein